MLLVFAFMICNNATNFHGDLISLGYIFANDLWFRGCIVAIVFEKKIFKITWAWRSILKLCTLSIIMKRFRLQQHQKERSKTWAIGTLWCSAFDVSKKSCHNTAKAEGLFLAWKPWKHQKRGKLPLLMYQIKWLEYQTMYNVSNWMIRIPDRFVCCD